MALRFDMSEDFEPIRTYAFGPMDLKIQILEAM